MNGYHRYEVQSLRLALECSRGGSLGFFGQEECSRGQLRTQTSEHLGCPSVDPTQELSLVIEQRPGKSQAGEPAHPLLATTRQVLGVQQQPLGEQLCETRQSTGKQGRNSVLGVAASCTWKQ